MPNAKGMLRIRHERVDGALPYVQQCALVPGLADYLAVDNADGTPAAMKTMKAPDAYRFPALPFIDVPMARKMLDDVEYATSRRFTSV